MLSIDLYHNGKVEGEQGIQKDAESINGWVFDGNRD